MQNWRLRPPVTHTANTKRLSIKLTFITDVSLRSTYVNYLLAAHRIFNYTQI